MKSIALIMVGAALAGSAAARCIAPAAPATSAWENAPKGRLEAALGEIEVYLTQSEIYFQCLDRIDTLASRRGGEPPQQWRRRIAQYNRGMAELNGVVNVYRARVETLTSR